MKRSLTLEQKLDRWHSIHPKTGCWEWTAALNAYGYAAVSDPGTNKVLRAHRASYELHRGPIPGGNVLDHVCRNRKCINPWHLRTCTHRENTLAGIGPTAVNARKTHCLIGHELSGHNIIWTGSTRKCRQCHNQRCYKRLKDPEVAERNRAYKRDWAKRKYWAAKT